MNYSELIKALRCKRDDCEGCDLAFFDKDEGWMCRYAAKDDDAADAIEAFQAEVPKQMNLVEVVRCKDCCWNQIQRFGNGKEYCECSRGNSRINDGDWFCPEGEKMEAQDDKV